MPKLTFIMADQSRIEADGVVGDSLMEAAVDADIEGITADCGGSCACATCHVFFDDAHFARVGAPEADEESMLEMEESRTATSRLSCQIELTDTLEGLEVHVPAIQ